MSMPFNKPGTVLTGPATENQINYIKGLLGDREPSMTLDLIQEEWSLLLENPPISKQAASNLITRLNKLPVIPKRAPRFVSGSAPAGVPTAPSPGPVTPGPIRPGWSAGATTAASRALGKTEPAEPGWRIVPGAGREWKPPFDLDLKTGEGLPRGRYAVPGRHGQLVFFKWDHNSRSGIWELRSQHGEHWQQVAATDWMNYLDSIFTGTGELKARIYLASMKYATELGRCYCCGKELTDPLSRALGIGPDCRSRGMSRT